MKEYNRHHIVAREKGGTSIPENITRIQIEVHNSIHRIFGTLLPHEQLQRLIQINSSALTREFKTDISRVLAEQDNEYVYIKGVLRRKH